MNNNDFDFEGFDSTGFGDSSDFGGFDSSPAENNTDQSLNSDTSNGSFDGLFDDGTQQNTADGSQPAPSNKKTIFIIIAIGVVGLLLVFFIAAKIGNKKQEANVNNTEYVQATEQTSSRGSQNVDNIMSTGNSNTTTNQQNTVNETKSVGYVLDENNFNWVEISSTENVAFNDNYTDMTFTVTSIKHYARSVDTNNNLVIKTSLLGSISGLSGTYVLDIPYDKGVKLVVGDSFTVHVQLGTYNNKTVVGEINY